MKNIVASVFLMFLLTVEATAGHIPSKTGNPVIDATIMVTGTLQGAGSAMMVRQYNPTRARRHLVDKPSTCQVDILTAKHVADKGPLSNDSNLFRTIHSDEDVDLAIMRGRVDHPCSELPTIRIARHAPPFATPIWRSGYPNGQRDYITGFFGDCLIRRDGYDWCMISIAVGKGSSGSGIFVDDLLVAVVQQGAGPYALSVNTESINEFMKYVYEAD